MSNGKRALKRPSLTITVFSKSQVESRGGAIGSGWQPDNSVFDQLMSQLGPQSPAVLRYATGGAEASLDISFRPRRVSSEAAGGRSPSAEPLPDSMTKEAETFVLQTAFFELSGRLNLFEFANYDTCYGTKSETTGGGLITFLVPSARCLSTAACSEMLRFAGRLMGFALRSRCQVNLQLAPFLWQIILNPALSTSLFRDGHTDVDTVEDYPVLHRMLTHDHRSLMQKYMNAALSLRAGLLEVVPGHSLVLFTPDEFVHIVCGVSE